MKVELTEVLWLDEQQTLSLPELAELSGLLETELRELMDCGVIVPVERSAADPRFSAGCIVTIRSAYRLRKDFELDTRGLTVALTLLERIRRLETQLSELHAQLPQPPR